jgi:uncharacterized integral membrane protein (TIGR00698 family)
MSYRCPHFRTGVAATACCAVAGINLSRLPGLQHLGPLTLALLLGLLWRAFLHVPENQHLGIGFSAKTLLRVGIVLLGVRLDFQLLAQAGVKIFLLGAGVIIVGLILFNALGNWFGLSGNLPMLIAVDSSICGASAVAAAAPAMNARDEETALVIPIGSLLGSVAVLGYTFFETWAQLPPRLYGILTGATLHEIAQVMAVNAAVPGALEAGTVSKLMRVVLLAPVVFGIGVWKQMRSAKGGRLRDALAMPNKPWFVLGFLAVGAACSLCQWALPGLGASLESIKSETVTVAVFLMAMAMAGVGIQTDFARLRADGAKSVAVAVLGWIGLVTFAAVFVFYVVK